MGQARRAIDAVAAVVAGDRAVAVDVARHAEVEARVGDAARGVDVGAQPAGALLLAIVRGRVADALRPWTLDFHVAQNDGTTLGSGTHAATGRHVPVDHPNGRLDITKHAGYWLRDEKGNLTRKTRHICWDGCIFPNAVMESQETWNAVLGAMLKVRYAHGWHE